MANAITVGARRRGITAFHSASDSGSLAHWIVYALSQISAGAHQFDQGVVGWDRTQALGRWAAGSCRYRLLIGTRRCLVPRLGQFLASPRFIPDGGIAPVRLGTAAFPLEPSHDG
jgi:hypothetical protein